MDGAVLEKNGGLAKSKESPVSAGRTSWVTTKAIGCPTWANPIRVHRPHYHFLKRCLDIGVASVALILAVPIVLAAACLIYLEDGRPIFFFQPRTGLGGRRFKMLKLRTMVRNADELRRELAELNELTWPDFKVSRDPRVTRVGRFLRATSLDELPQLLNVLRVEMSLVGPRPTSFAADTYDLWHTERLEVLPGITGLWQINGRSDVDFADRVRMDIDYIERRSIWLDIQILFLTLGAVIFRRGAY